MEEHVPSHAQMEEEQMTKPMNTLIVWTSPPKGKDYCNDLGNNDAPLQQPPHPTIRHTRSMVRESLPTQSTEREGTTISTLNDNELYVPILDFMKKKKMQFYTIKICICISRFIH